MGQMGGGVGGGGLCKSLELIATQNHEKVRIYDKEFMHRFIPMPQPCNSQKWLAFTFISSSSR